MITTNKKIPIRRIKVGIIDDGISPAFLYNPNGHIISHYKTRHNQIVEYVPMEKITHGTICASIFSEYSVNCDIVDICVFEDNDDKGEEIQNEIITALDWCGNNEIDIISMSVGTLTDFELDEIKKSIVKLIKKNILIVAACNNTNKVTFPASLHGVIGVRHSNIVNNGFFYYIPVPYDGIEIQASLPNSCQSIKHFCKDFDWNLTPNSWVTPYIASQIIKIPPPFLLSKVCSYLKQNYLYKFPADLQKLYCELFKPHDNTEVPIVCFFGSTSWFISKIVKVLTKKGYKCLQFNHKSNIINKIIPLNLVSEYKIPIRDLIYIGNASFSPDLIIFKYETSEYYINELPPIDLLVCPINNEKDLPKSSSTLTYFDFNYNKAAYEIIGILS